MGAISPPPATATATFPRAAHWVNDQQVVRFGPLEFAARESAQQFVMRRTTGIANVTVRGVVTFQMAGTSNTTTRAITLTRTWRPIWPTWNANYTWAGSCEKFLYTLNGGATFNLFTGTVGHGYDNNIIIVEEMSG